MSLRSLTCAATAMTAALALAAAPAQATRAALSPDGAYLDITESTAGEVNTILASLHVENGAATVHLIDDQPVQAGNGCDHDPDLGVTVCADPSVQIRVSLGGGDDRFQPTEIGTSVTFGEGALAVDLGAGADTYDARGTNAMAVVHGGSGNDQLLGGHNGDHLHGDDGDDLLDGAKGADELRGGPGADRLKGDGPSDHGVFADILDGGDGVDLLDDYVYAGEPTHAPPITVTLDGQANDGRQGENDNVVAVERIKSGSAGSFTGDAGDNEFVAPQVGPPGVIAGGGGNDTLIAGDAHGDVIDGGAGDDLVEGGFGDDKLTGGPGRDTVNGDRKSRCNELACDLYIAGNDVIDVRDDEVDSVTCGPGTDRVIADAADVVAADCETVERGSGGPNDGSGGGPDTSGGPDKVGDHLPPSTGTTFTISRTRLRQALRRGLVVRVRGVSGTVRLKARHRGRVVAQGSARASGGRATVRLRFTKAAQRLLRRERKVSLRIATADASRVVVLKR